VLAALALIALLTLPYLLTRFDYEVDTSAGFLVIVMWWCGFFRITRSVSFESIRSVRRISRTKDIIPLVSGTFPSLWGRFRPSRMVAVFCAERGRFFPLLVTPADPEDFIAKIRNEIRTDSFW
jgi:hypothetical protein